MGDFQSSANHFEETIRLSISKGKQPLNNLYMVEPQVASLLLLSWDLWFLGHPIKPFRAFRKRSLWLGDLVTHIRSVRLIT